MSSPSYLKRRGNIWYAQLSVPLDCQSVVGAKVLTQSLGTSDKLEAHRLKHAVLAQMQRRVSGPLPPLAKAPVPTAGGTEHLLAEALSARSDIEANNDPANAQRAFDAAVEAFLVRQAKVHGVDDHGHPNLTDETLGQVRRAYKTVRGTLSDTLGQRVETYLTERAGPLRGRTIEEKRRHLTNFSLWFGSDRGCVEVTRKDAGRYVESVIQRRTRESPDGRLQTLSGSARSKETSNLRSFFEWVMLRGVIEANPFDKMTRSMRDSKRGKAQARRPWRAEEVGRVLEAAEHGDPIWPLVALGAYTGARLEEIAQLKASDVDGCALVIREGKTEAAARRVPIHPVIAPLVAQLAKTTTDGYLLSGLLTSGVDDSRGAQIGKRLQYLMRNAAAITDTRVVFHAFRNTVASQLAEAGVALPTVQWIIGHEHSGVTLKVYSERPSDKTLLQALKLVSFGPNVDSLVMLKGGKFAITRRTIARRRRRAKG